MQIIRGLHNLRAEHHGSVVTIGNFDGVHLGHQSVLQQLKQKAFEFQLPSTVIVFEPQPLEFFAPDKAPARLTRLREKLQVLKDCSIERVLLLAFNQSLASMTPNEFIETLLVQGLGTRFLYVGDDFRFGCQRKGDFSLLQDVGKTSGFDVDDMPSFSLNGERVSSTLIRQALGQGDLAKVKHFLGRNYQICGHVAHGHKLGRTIGFPTANIHLSRNISPLQGVFCVTLFGMDNQPRQGVANIGNRPVLASDNRYLLEVHLFDFKDDIYGQLVRVTFDHFLREEVYFESFEVMREQIERDAQDARDFFAAIGK